MSRPYLVACSVAAAAVAAACSAFAPVSVRPGQSADEVTRALGQPTGRYALPQGTRLAEPAVAPPLPPATLDGTSLVLPPCGAAFAMLL